MIKWKEAEEEQREAALVEESWRVDDLVNPPRNLVSLNSPSAENPKRWFPSRSPLLLLCNPSRIIGKPWKGLISWRPQRHLQLPWLDH